jgi:MFS family permease
LNHRPLFNRGFISLLTTQFFGAANDNTLRQVLTLMVTGGLWKEALGAGGQAYIALCLNLPFILFSAFAGQVADRFSKRDVMIGIKIAELPIAAMALLGLWTENLWITLVAFVLIATQSTFFGPVKYGVVPELVADRELSRANGFLNMFTNVAVLVGITIGGPVADLYFPMKSGKPDPTKTALLWLPGVVMSLLAVVGLAAVMLMPRLKSGDPNLKYRINPLSTYWQALKEMAGGPLLIIAFAWAFFYLVAMMALLILPEYKNFVTLHGKLIDFTQNSYLFAALGVSIGLGSVLAGWISGEHIKPRLIPIGALGMTAGFFALGLIPANYWLLIVLLPASGLFAGFYIVPLQALLQKLSPKEERGRFLGTTNALAFVFSSLGAIIFWISANAMTMMSDRASQEPLRYDRIFLVCGTLALLATGIALYRLRALLREHATV